MVGGDQGRDRVTAGQLYPRVGQRLCAEQGGDAGHQSAGGVRLAVTELAEQVPLGSHDVDAVRLGVLAHGLGDAQNGPITRVKRSLMTARARTWGARQHVGVSAA
jgi:hypothetical protein